MADPAAPAPAAAAAPSTSAPPPVGPASPGRASLGAPALAAVRALFVVLMAFAIAPPFVPIAGPLSADDLPPLVAVVLALFVLAFSPKRLELDASVAGFALLGLLGLASAGANAESLGDLARLAGRSTGRAAFVVALIAGTRALLDHPRWPRIALSVFALAATAEAAFCVWAWATRYHGPYGIGSIPFPDWSVLKGSVRVQGTFSGTASEFETDAVSANFLAAYFVISIPATFGLALGQKRDDLRLVVLGAAALQLLALYLTYTRAALVALGAPILVIGWILGKRRLAALALVLAVAASLSIPTVRAKFFGEAHNRWALWGASAMITRDAPLLGVGDGNYDRALYGKQEYYDTPWGVSSTSSHNSVLLSAAYHGLAGALVHLLLYALLALVAVRAARRVRDEGLDASDRFLAAGVVGALSGYLVQDQFNNLFYVPKVVTQLWFLFGVLLALAAAGTRRQTP